MNAGKEPEVVQIGSACWVPGQEMKKPLDLAIPFIKPDLRPDSQHGGEAEALLALGHWRLQEHNGIYTRQDLKRPTPCLCVTTGVGRKGESLPGIRMNSGILQREPAD